MGILSSGHSVSIDVVAFSLKLFVIHGHRHNVLEATKKLGSGIEKMRVS